MYIYITKSKLGKPSELFDNAPYWSKKRKSDEIGVERGVDKLLHAGMMKLKKKRRIEDDKVLNNLHSTKDDGSCSIKNLSNYSSSEALAVQQDS